MYADMDEWAEIRKRVLIGGESKRAILRETGMNWRTLEKILAHSEPPGYRQSQARKKPMIGPHINRIAQWLEEDRQLPKKQRHTAKRIWERLQQEEGYKGRYMSVKGLVRVVGPPRIGPLRMRWFSGKTRRTINEENATHDRTDHPHPA